MSSLISATNIYFPVMNNIPTAYVQGFQLYLMPLIHFSFHIITPFKTRCLLFISATIPADKNTLKGNILTTSKDIHNGDAVFDPSQNDRLDINPGCFMKMPVICPSIVMILSELTAKTKNELWKVKCTPLIVQWINKWISVCHTLLYVFFFQKRLSCQDYVFIWTLFCQKNKTNQ